jgi:hypothetical protein
MRRTWHAARIVKGKVVPVFFNWEPRQEGVLGERRYSSTHNWTRHYVKVICQFRARPLYPQGKNPWRPFGRRVGGPRSRSGHGGEEKNSQLVPGIEPPIIQLVA